MTRNSRRVVVIGAGIAGLCAAVYARRCGYKVDVLEQHDRPGGLATSFDGRPVGDARRRVAVWPDNGASGDSSAMPA